MVFVRVKKINGGEYAYLVENSWTDKGARQKVGEYLGKVYRPQKAKSEGLAGFLQADPATFIRQAEFTQIAKSLIELELRNHELKKEDFAIDFEQGIVKNARQKDAAIAMNSGFLCNYTFKRLLGYKPDEDYSGYLLADLITAAGILPEQDVFIELYAKFKDTYETAAARKFEFYY